MLVNKHLSTGKGLLINIITQLNLEVIVCALGNFSVRFYSHFAMVRITLFEYADSSVYLKKCLE
jgi:hypothetical protein